MKEVFYRKLIMKGVASMVKEGISHHEALMKLHEIGLSVNELKGKGLNQVPVDQYEKLLSWSIETVREMGDKYDQLLGAHDESKKAIDQLLTKLNPN
jgi:hypothetical protein